MKNTIIIIIFFSLFLTVCKGQTNSNIKNNALSLELGKVGLIANLSFDHKFKTKNYGYHFDIGSNFLKYKQVFQTGGGLYYLSGHKNNFLELGIDLKYFEFVETSDDQISLVLLFIHKPTNTIYSTINIGYRYYGNKSLFRVGISLGFMNSGFVAGGYISSGFRL